MKEPTKNELLGELARLRAENERLLRVVASQRPELQQLRDIEVGVRHYLQHAEMALAYVHAQCVALLPGEDDLPSLAEVSGIFGKGKARVDAALNRSTEPTS